MVFPQRQGRVGRCGSPPVAPLDRRFLYEVGTVKGDEATGNGRTSPSERPGTDPPFIRPEAGHLRVRPGTVVLYCGLPLLNVGHVRWDTGASGGV